MARVGRDRSRYKRLPKGWRPAKSGAIYFRPQNAEDREIVLGITGGPMSIKLADELNAAYRSPDWLRIVAARTKREQDDEYEPGTLAELCALAQPGRPNSFLDSIEHPKTRAERTRHIEELREEFGTRRYAMNVFDASRDRAGFYFRAMDAERHRLRFKGKRGAVSANRRLRTWELLFSWARAPLGLTEYNPCAGLTELKEKPRKVVPKDPSIFKLYRELSPPARFMVGMIRFYGRRKIELLRLDVSDGKEDGIHLTRGKDDEEKPIIIRWDPRNKRMWERATRWRESVIHPQRRWKNGKKKPAPRIVDATALLLNSRGRRLTESGFNTERQRAMKLAGIQGEFTFHDMRKTRAQDGLTLEEAQNVLAHDDKRTTAGVYRPESPIVVDMNREVAAKRRKG